jgi:DNA-directed RNA polymerase subunit alpha
MSRITEQEYFNAIQVVRQYNIQLKQDLLREWHDIPIYDVRFDLSIRALNCLNRMRIRTIGELTEVRKRRLLSGEGFGKKTVAEIEDFLKDKFDITLKP